MTGLPSVSRVGPIGPGPSSGMGRRSPSATALRSAPAQNVPPAPVRTATARSSSWSKATKASRNWSAQTLSTALRRSGRLMVTTVTGPSCSTSRESARYGRYGPDEGSSVTGGGHMEAFSHGGPGSPFMELRLERR